jgi:HD-GYP domain-containing protein (c-di-GMP phosphodiesterase class II)
MRTIRLDALDEGTVLGKDVLAPGGQPLLRKGVKLTARYIRSLMDAGVSSVWIEDDLSEGIEPVTAITDETRVKATNAVRSALGDAREAMAKGRSLSPEAMQELSAVAEQIALEVSSSADLAVHLADMAGSDQYLLQHSVDVCALGVLIARRHLARHGWTDFTGRRRFDQLDGRLTKLGLGLLLHDVGKLVVPHDVLHKRGKLAEDEWALLKQHPVIGFDMLTDEVGYLVKAVVRSHHERWDGGGYPDGLAGDAIHEFARIAAAADVYDAVTSERSYKAAAPPHIGVDIITSGAGTQFDPAVVDAFSAVVAPYPPGQEVLLADGRRGVVVEVDLEDPLRPTVRARTPYGGVEEIPRAIVAGAGTGEHSAAAA